MSHIQIFARKNGVGIDRDVQLMQRALSELGDVSWKDSRKLWPLQNSFGRGLGRRFSNCVESSQTQLHILTERVPRLLGRLPGPVALVPNQERFPRRHLRRLKNVDHILCKTRHAEAIFRKYSSSVRYIGFTSQDRRISGVRPDYGRFFHLAGRSALKGTGTLINVWSRHPEWPELTVVQSGTGPWRVLPKNIKVIDRYLPDDELQQLQNECGVHLCPSLSEGWGHYVVEAMSCGAVVLTTDGAPMNEIVQPQHGVLVPWIRAERRHLGTNWYADPDALEDAITKIIQQPDTEKIRMGSAARNWFEQNDRKFAGRICGVASAILADYQAVAQPKHVSMPLGTAACEHSMAHQGTFS